MLKLSLVNLLTRISIGNAIMTQLNAFKRLWLACLLYIYFYWCNIYIYTLFFVNRKQEHKHIYFHTKRTYLYKTMSSSSLTSSSSTSSSSSSESDAADEVFFQTVVAATKAFLQQPQSTPRARKPALNRNRLRAHTMLVNDYFKGVDSTYPDDIFRRRFWMHQPLFSSILEDVERVNPWFQQRYDARGRIGFSALQKCTGGYSANGIWDRSWCIWRILDDVERTMRLCIYKFSKTIITLYGRRFLRLILL